MEERGVRLTKMEEGEWQTNWGTRKDLPEKTRGGKEWKAFRNGECWSAHTERWIWLVAKICKDESKVESGGESAGKHMEGKTEADARAIPNRREIAGSSHLTQLVPHSFSLFFYCFFFLLLCGAQTWEGLLWMPCRVNCL